WPRLLFTPTAHPVTALTRQLAASLDIDPDGVEEAAGPQEWVAMLRGALRDRVDVGEAGARLVMIVDQLEELFTQCTDEAERHSFLDLISHVAARGPNGEDPVGLVVYGLRADFYAPCADYPQLRAALQDG